MSVRTSKVSIEIDHVDRDLSAAISNKGIEIGIGWGTGPGGTYMRWTDIELTVEETKALHDWLTSALETT